MNLLATDAHPTVARLLDSYIDIGAFEYAASMEEWKSAKADANLDQDLLGEGESFLCKSYPNPCNGSFSISTYASESSVLDVTLFNGLGREVYRQAVNTLAGLAETRGDTHLPPGAYVLRVTDPKGEQLLLEKLIVQ